MINFILFEIKRNRKFWNEFTWSESSWPVLLSVLILWTERSEPNPNADSGKPKPNPNGGPRICGSSSSSSSDPDPRSESRNEK